MTQINRKSTETPAGATLPTRPQKSFWNVSRKLLIPSMAVMILLALGLIVYITIFTIQRNQTEATRDLTRTASAVETSIEELQTLALGLGTEMANNPQVQAAFAAQDRQLLTEITLPTFEVVQKEFDVKQFQFIQPPATSFLRLHQLDKYGDDLSSIRFTVLEANATKKPVSGIEIGRGGLGVRGEVPVFYQGQHLGVMDVGLDIGPAYLEKIKKQYGVDLQVLLEKEAAQAATFTGVTSEVTGPTPNLLLQASTFEEPLYANKNIYERVLNGEAVVSRIKFAGKTYSVISTPLKDYSGKVIGVLEISLDRTEIIASQSRSLIFSVLLSLIATVLGGFILARFINSTLQPISTLTETATALASGDLERQAVVQSKDELGILASAFNNMTSRLRELIGGLEARVAERTRNLELAAEVGRSVSQVRELGPMLKDAAEIIRSRFDLYYTQVYLANPSQNTLILQSGTGVVGAELVGRGHRLPIDSGSINGRAAVEKRPVIISDTTASATFRPNPLLPDTRSEMAVPLLIGDKVVGVLDLQSRQVGALSQEVLPAFETLAGQLAIAIKNAELLAETEQARAEVETQARRLMHANWENYLDAIHKPEQTGYVFEGNNIIPLAEAEGLQPPVQENTISAPITVTGETLGSLVVEMNAENQNPQNVNLVNIVARQVAQQIESLRLLESAERYRIEVEQAARRLTSEGWKKYMEARSNVDLGYLYDLNEVHPLKDAQQSEIDTLTLPLKIRDETVGRLAIQGLAADDQDSLELVSAVAERLGAHIEGLRQYDQTQSALAQSEKLFNASRSLTQATDLQELVSAAVTTLSIPVVNRALLATFDYDAKGEVERLNIIANWWNGTGHDVTAIGTRYPIEVIRVMPMFISRTPVFFDDTLDDERVDATTLELVKRLNLRAVAVLPLHLGSRQIGALILEAEGPHNFTQDEIRLFSALAPQIATVVENRRQFEQAQKQAERESTLNTISQKIQSATTVEAVLQIAARELGHALGAPLTIAQLGMKDHGNVQN